MIEIVITNDGEKVQMCSLLLLDSIDEEGDWFGGVVEKYS